MIIGKSLTALCSGGLKPEIIVTAKAGSLLNLRFKGSSIILQSYQLGATETQHTFVVGVNETAYIIDNATFEASVEVLVNNIAQYTVYIPYYGNGSLNAVVNGYNDKLVLNGEKLSRQAQTYSTGNLNDSVYHVRNLVANFGSLSYLGMISAGNNSFNCAVDATQENIAVNFFISFGYNGSSGANYISNLRLTCDGSAKTLSELVSLGWIKPIVIITCSASGDYVYPNVLNLYSGNSTGAKRYAMIDVYLALRSGHKITNISFYSAYPNQDTNDGVWITSASNSDVDISLLLT